ncbi:hypothetical protein Ddc_15843 [Ditylenchus destructor]|nr:hypothetical protein Ddc_15843 [Ditylenchus destructor]
MDGNAPNPQITKTSHGTTKLNKDTNAKEIRDFVAKDYNPARKGLYIHLSNVLVDSELMTYTINSKSPARKIQITPQTIMTIEYI